MFNKNVSGILFCLAVILVFSGDLVAQRNIDPAIDRDPLLEADANHNLDVARLAFGPRKAYKQVLLRFEETFAAHPEFSKMEEFLYLAGMSSYYLSENKGRQKVNLKIEREREKYAPEKLREDAVAYLSMMLERHPDSKYKEDANRVLKELKDQS
jgi:outer membrane protein assembly factor BamD (BamD/ComL family)